MKNRRGLGAGFLKFFVWFAFGFALWLIYTSLEEWTRSQLNGSVWSPLIVGVFLMFVLIFIYKRGILSMLK